jgi:sporulation protein YlmC with PRC-barrel domain
MNKTKWITSFLSAGLLAVVAGPAWSVEPGTQSGQGSSQGMETEMGTGQTESPGMGTQGTTGRSQGINQGTAMTSSLQDKTANDIIGMDVVGARDEDIGEVENLVLNQSTKDVEAVIETGDVLGLGGKQVVIPLNELVLRDDKLRTTLTQAQLKQRKEYNKESTQYTEITQKDRPISEFAAFE